MIRTSSSSSLPSQPPPSPSSSSDEDSPSPSPTTQSRPPYAQPHLALSLPPPTPSFIEVKTEWTPRSDPHPSPLSDQALLSPTETKETLPAHWHVGDVREGRAVSAPVLVQSPPTLGDVSLVPCSPAPYPSSVSSGADGVGWSVSMKSSLAFISPRAYGVWGVYAAQYAVASCVVFGPFSIVWWWYGIAPLYGPPLNLIAGGYSLLLAALVLYEERGDDGVAPLLHMGDIWDASISRYHFRSLFYLVASLPLMLSWPTLVPASALLITAAINRIACARGELFTSRKRERRRTQTAEGLMGSRVCGRLVEWGWRVMYIRRMNLLGVVVWALIYTLGNVALFTVTALTWKAQVDQSIVSASRDLIPPNMTMSYWIIPAKAFGVLLDVNCALILLPVCRSLIRCLYQWSTHDQRLLTRLLRLLLKLVPLDFPVAAHRVMGVLILVAAVGHTVAHLMNLAMAYQWTLITLGGIWALISGGFLCVVMLLMYSSAVRRVRLAQFAVFFELHHLFLLFYALLLVHGAHGVGPNFWKYAIVPGVIYVGERVLRVFRGNQEVQLLSVTLMQEVMCLEFAKAGVLKGGVSHWSVHPAAVPRTVIAGVASIHYQQCPQ